MIHLEYKEKGNINDEGKSCIGVLLKHLYGRAISTGNLYNLETNRFARAALENAYLFLDDDMMMNKLNETNVLKTIITNEGKMLIEKKGIQPYSANIYAKLMSFGNGLLQSLTDRSDGFFRRQIIITTKPKAEAKEKNIYTIDEIAHIFELLDGDDVPLKFRVFFKLAVYSGYRRGELLGLEWKDIDFDNNVISVKRTSNYTADKGIYTDTTKTKKSQRSQKFPEYVMDMLKELKAEQDKERVRLGDKWIETDRLFVKWDGRPMHNNTPYFWFTEFCEKNNVRFCDIHSVICMPAY